MTGELKAVEERLRVVEILLAVLLLKGGGGPEVEKLEKLIGIRKGTLSSIFPQRQAKKPLGRRSLQLHESDQGPKAA